MKISTFVSMLLVSGMLIFLMAQMTTEADQKYDIGINQSDWAGQYDFTSTVNDSLSPIQQSLNDIQNEEKGWLEKVGAGFTGLISAIKFLPSLVWEAGKMGGTLITGIGTSFNVPSAIILTFLVALLVWGIIKLVEFYQRWQI